MYDICLQEEGIGLTVFLKKVLEFGNSPNVQPFYISYVSVRCASNIHHSSSRLF